MIAIFWAGCGEESGSSQVKEYEPWFEGSTPMESHPELVPPTEPCGNQVASTWPADEATGVFYRTVVEAELALVDPTATLQVVSSEGVPVPGELLVEETFLRFFPDPLAPLTNYQVLVTYDCGVEVFEFTTSEVGSPVSVDLVDRTYELRTGEGTWLEPPGGMGVLGAILPDLNLLLMFRGFEINPAASDFWLGVSVDDMQYPCTPTLEFLDETWEDPYFQIEEPGVNLALDWLELHLEDLQITGGVAPDGSYIQGASVRAVLDTRAMGDELGLGSAPDAVCVLLGSLGAPCSACDDGQDLCFPLHVVGVPADRVPMMLQELTVEDVQGTDMCGD